MITWKRKANGWVSADGQFVISPLFGGSTTVREWKLAGLAGGYEYRANTLKECKAAAQNAVEVAA
jgi:hypothetical protein